jgi:hypothetical protein
MANKAKIDKAAVRAAMEKLRKAGENHQSISAIREALGGIGSNDTIKALRDDCLADMASEAASTRKLTPAQQAMALELMTHAVSGITAELESAADGRIQECQAKAEAEVRKSESLAEEALLEAGRRVAERDHALSELSEITHLQRKTQEEAVRLKALLEVRSSEIEKLIAMLERALAERDSALAAASELRGRLAAMTDGKGA